MAAAGSGKENWVSGAVQGLVGESRRGGLDVIRAAGSSMHCVEAFQFDYYFNIYLGCCGVVRSDISSEG